MRAKEFITEDRPAESDRFADGRLKFTNHVKQRSDQRGIPMADIVQALKSLETLRGKDLRQLPPTGFVVKAPQGFELAIVKSQDLDTKKIDYTVTTVSRRLKLGAGQRVLYLESEPTVDPIRMGKLEKTGQVVRILRRDEKGDWLIDTQPHLRNSMGVKWLDSDTKWTWIRDFKNLKELFDRPVKDRPATARTRSRFVSQVGDHEVEVFFKNTDRGLEINFAVDGRGFALEKDRGKHGSQQTLMAAINMILARLPEAVAYYRPQRVWYKSIGTDTSRAKLYDRLLPLLQRALGPEWRASTEHAPGWNLYYLDRQQNLKEARIPRAIEEFLDSLNPDDCGVEDIGAYRIHFEGFTSDCKSSADYRKNPEAVYQQVYQDFIRREGGAQPLVQDMVGDERFPILYSIFRKQQAIKENAGYVTRIDSQPIENFAKNMQTYYHTDDFSQSGQFAPGSKIPKKYTGKMTGVYAGEPQFTALYATGNASQTRYVAKYGPGQPIVYFDRKDLPAIRARRTYLTVFDANRFKKLPTGEYFSSDPGPPVKPQEEIADPFQYIKNQGWEIRVVDDLPAVLKKLQATKVRYGAEGMDLQESTREAQQATAQQVLAYINKTHHEPFEPGSKMRAAVLAHPQWELVQVPLLNLNIPDEEYDDMDPDYEPDADPYGRVMMVEPGHAGEVSANLIDRQPIVIDADRYIIDGNHRAWAAKYLLNRDYIQAWRPVAQVNEVNYPDELTVSDQIQNYFFKRGYELAGEGRDQMAFESPRGTILKVLGIGEDEREQIVKNYVRFFEQNQRNPFYPRIYNSGNFTVDGETYFVYEMERVNYVANEEATLDYIEKLMSAVDRGRGPEFVKQNPVPDEIGQQQLAGLLRATEHMIQALGGQAPLDLSTVENLGRRNNGHLVIVDPYSL